MLLALLVFYKGDIIIIFVVNNNTSNHQYQKHAKSKLPYLKMGFAHRIYNFKTSALTEENCLDFYAQILRFTVFCTTLHLIRICIALHQPFCLYFLLIFHIACMKLVVSSAFLAVIWSNNQSKAEHHVLCFTVSNKGTAQAAWTHKKLSDGFVSVFLSLLCTV